MAMAVGLIGSPMVDAYGRPDKYGGKDAASGEPVIHTDRISMGRPLPPPPTRRKPVGSRTFEPTGNITPEGQALLAALLELPAMQRIHVRAELAAHGFPHPNRVPRANYVLALDVFEAACESWVEHE